MIQINFAGNLVRDPEVRQGKNSPYTTFSVAATHGAKDGSDPNKPGTEFIECIAGGKTGENIGKFLHKGDQIIVYGTVQKLSAWLGKKDNQPHGGLNVNVNGFEFGRRKSGEAGGAPAGGSAGPELSEDDIPF